MTIIDRPWTAQRVRAIRLALGMTNLEFAYNLRVSLNTVSKWQMGRAKPSPLAEQAIKALCVAYGVDYREVRA